MALETVEAGNRVGRGADLGVETSFPAVLNSEHKPLKAAPQARNIAIVERGFVVALAGSMAEARALLGGAGR